MSKENIKELKARIAQLEKILDKRTFQLTEEIREYIATRAELEKTRERLRHLGTEQKEIENTVLENIPVSLTLTDNDGRFWYVNQRAEEIMGLPRKDFLNKTITELFPEEGKQTLASIRGVFRSKQGMTVEQSYRINGVNRYFEMTRKPIFGDSGTVSFVLSIGMEITERKRMEVLMQFQHTIDSLQSVTDTFEKSLDLMFDNLFQLEWVDAGGLYLFNEGRDTLDLVYHRGLSSAFVETTASYDLDSPNTRIVLSKVARFINTANYLSSSRDAIISEGISLVVALPLVYKDEVIGSLNLASRTVSDLDDFNKMSVESITGRLANLLVLINTQRDLKKKNEELAETLADLQLNRQMLIQKGRLEALGELLAGLAHEINQPLSVISLALGNLEANLMEGNMTDEYFKNKVASVMKNIDKIKDLIDHVRIFSRDQNEMKFEQIDINQTIRDALSMVNEQLNHHNVSVKLELDDGIGLCVGNPSRLEQVFLNLLNNARDALDEKEAAGQPNGFEKRIHITSKKSGKKVTVTFFDSGTGIRPEHIDRIFDPFFTTKGSGHGTGLGLPIVYGIIRDMRGEITARSVAGEFTEIMITLPSPIKRSNV